MITFITDMSVKELLAYREFDRVAEPAPKIAIFQMYNVDQVTEWVRSHGITKPLELSIFEDKALLTDGNHRVVAADRLNMDMVPVQGTYYDTIQELETTFYQTTIQRFKQSKFIND